MATVTIGDKKINTNDQAALAAAIAELTEARETAKREAEASKAEAERVKAEAAARTAAATRGFEMKLARYSQTHEKTLEPLRGKLKGAVTITSEQSPFGLHLTPAQWAELKTHTTEIDAYMAEHKQTLIDAELEAKRIKGHKAK